MEKCVIAAVVDNGAIGKDSYLLCHIPWRTSFPGDWSGDLGGELGRSGRYRSGNRSYLRI